MIILNEKKYAEECIQNCNIGDNPFETLIILAKYFYHVKGYKRKRITQELEKFISKTYPKYIDNRLYWDASIDKIANKAGKYELHEIDGVSITQSELAVIGALEDKELRLLAFTLLCLAKLGNKKNPCNNGWVNNERKEIFELARVSCPVYSRDYRLGELQDFGYLEFPKRFDNISVRVTFINDSSPEAFVVSDFRELGYEYLFHCGENFIRCCECGILVRGNKNGTKKYCSNCEGYTKRSAKTIICADCGKEFVVCGSNKRTVRCPICQSVRDNELAKMRMRKMRKS